MKIEKYLVLNKYLLSLFGVEEFKELQEKLRNAPIGTDIDGRTHFINVLRSSFEEINKNKLSEDTLLKYDENIRWYESQINRQRQPKITLKYFQYLAILFTEIFLDNFKNRKKEFLYELNEFLRHYGEEKGVEVIDKFGEKDLNKLAFWMATGSGKTLITHINYYQFFRYKLFEPDNILLITPNEGLSKQHFEELQKSGIPCRLYDGNLNSLGSRIDEKGVLILEMTKLVEEKKGGGVTLPVEVFEGRNLLFVDEGHKGKKSEEQKWARLRNKIAEKGFVFEYSATFGQILSERNKKILKEYAKAIIFDYSYKYFYLDGYGKDFSVLNIKQVRIDEQQFQETMFVANLLAFYEQVLVYDENKDLAAEYNLEKPLWIFVGTTVTGKQEESDVVQIVEFLKRVISEEDWVKEKSEKIFGGNSGLKNDANKDIFDEKFSYLKDSGLKFDEVYKRLFGGRGNFGTYEIKNAEGEVGLKVGENDYFGVVNIGNVSGFKKELEKKGITVSQDAVSSSLFDDIKKQGSPINILVGSKKFIEGWDTWRVSSMGLLNIGTGQGPQIIQLFGRGVRLKGKGFSLKRSGREPVQFLESLNIYGIKADYLSRFLEAISKEEIELETIEIPVKAQHQEKWGALYTLSKNENKKFEEEEVLRLKANGASFTLDLLPRVAFYQGIEVQKIRAETQEISLPGNLTSLFNWEKILKEIYDFKNNKGYWNLIIDKPTLKNILLSDQCKISASLEILAVKTEEDLRQIEEIAILLIKKYLDLFYRRYSKRFETENMRYGKVAKQEVLFVFDKGKGQYTYSVQVKKSEKDLIKKIRKLAENFEELIKNDEQDLPRIYFDRHFYLPILLQSKKIEKISPAGLVESEKKFILDLRKYLKNNKEKFAGFEIFLVRNFSKSGVGFFNLSGFYPDFILWLKNGRKQKVVFIDPKGLEHTKRLDDQKIKLAEEIKLLERKLAKKTINLESFILSKTSYKQLIAGGTKPEPKEEYLKHHVLFLEDKKWPEYFFEELNR